MFFSFTLTISHLRARNLMFSSFLQRNASYRCDICDGKILLSWKSLLDHRETEEHLQRVYESFFPPAPLPGDFLSVLTNLFIYRDTLANISLVNEYRSKSAKRPRATVADIEPNDHRRKRRKPVQNNGGTVVAPGPQRAAAAVGPDPNLGAVDLQDDANDLVDHAAAVANDPVYFGPPNPTSAQLWDALADRARDEHPDDSPGLISLINEKSPTCVLLARIASHYKWSEGELEVVLRGLLPVYASTRDDTINSMIESSKRVTVSDLIESGLHNESPSFAPRIAEFQTRSGSSINLPIWSARRQLEDFINTKHLSKYLIAKSAFNGQTFGHFVTGTEFRDCCEKCGADVIPVCLELAYDDTNLGNSSAGPMFLGISNLDDAVKGQNRFVGLLILL